MFERVQSLLLWVHGEMEGVDLEGPKDDRGCLLAAVNICDAWITDEQRYRDKYNSRGTRARARMARDRTPVEDNTIEVLITRVRKILTVDRVPWASSFISHKFVLAQNERRDATYEAKRGQGMIITNMGPYLEFARDHVDAPECDVAVRISCLIIVSGLRGIELRDPQYEFTDAGGGRFHSNMRAKGGLTDHVAPLLCSFSKFEEGVRLLRLTPPALLRRLQYRRQAPSFLAPLAERHFLHFGKRLNIHQLRQVYVALCFQEEYSGVPFARQAGFEGCISRYLGHGSQGAASCYSFCRHCPAAAFGEYI